MNVLNNWLILNSNGGWERDYGFKITSMSDPGWLITIDTVGTCLDGIVLEYAENVDSELSYFKISTENNAIKIVAGVYGIDKALAYFSDEIIPSYSNFYFYYDIYMPVNYKQILVGWLPMKAKITNLFSLEIIDFGIWELRELKLVSYDTMDINLLPKDFMETIRKDFEVYIGKVLKYHLVYSLGNVFIVGDVSDYELK